MATARSSDPGPDTSAHPAPDAGAPPARASRARAALALGAVLALALAARLVPYATVFTRDGVRLTTDGDTYYHALRAERIAQDWPHVPWRDEAMNHPYGADVPWPPLFDALVAAVAVVTGDGSSEHVAAVAAVVPVVLGLAVVLVTAWLGVLFVGGAGWEAALLVALLVGTVLQSLVGRADHHVLETLLYGLAFAGMGAGMRRPGWAPALLLGGALALAFWNWSGSAMYLVVLGACVATVHLAVPAGGREAGAAATTLARGALAAAALLAVSIPWLGPPGALRSVSLTPVTGLSVVLAALTAAGAFALALARRLRPEAPLPERCLHLAGAAALLLVALLVAPAGLRAGILHGATAVNAGNAWYESITEFYPLVFSGAESLSLELRTLAAVFGLTPLLLVAALVLLARGRRPAGAGAGRLALLLAWAVLAVILAFARRRFQGYAVVPLALVAAGVVREAAPWLAARVRGREAWARAAALALVVSPALPRLDTTGAGVRPVGALDKNPLLGWLRAQPVTAGREGVLAFWADGHEIQWFARRPVVSTPFGSDIDARSLAAEAAFVTARDPLAARALVDERRVGYLLLQPTAVAIATVGRLAAPSTVYALEQRSLTHGRSYLMTEEMFDLVASRLYFLDGGSRQGAPALADYRLVAESPTPVDIAVFRTQRYKLFEVVEGARLEVAGLAPGVPLQCGTVVTTNLGRKFWWLSAAVAGGEGTASCRVPYATDANGLVKAAPYTLMSGDRRATVEVAEDAVRSGRALRVTLRR